MKYVVGSFTVEKVKDTDQISVHVDDPNEEYNSITTYLDLGEAGELAGLLQDLIAEIKESKL